MKINKSSDILCNKIKIKIFIKKKSNLKSKDIKILKTLIH